MSLPSINLTIDGQELPVMGPQWNHEMGGMGQATVAVPEDEARKHNIAYQSELKLFTSDGTCRYHGRVAARPRYTADGFAEITAVGYRDLADKAAGRRHYMSYALDQWTEMDSGEHGYAVEGNKALADIRAGSVRFFAAIGTSMSVGDRNGILAWIPGDTVTSVAFTAGGDVDANNNIRIYSADGPSGSLTVENDYTSTGAKDFTLATANQDMVGVAYRRGASAAVLGTNIRQVLTNLRVRCRANDDTMTGAEVLEGIAADLGYDDSGVSSALSTNILPLDWESGAWSGLMAYVCMLHDGWFNVLDDRGSGPYLEANKWANSETWTCAQSRGAIVNLAPQEPFDGLVVNYVTPGGRPRRVTAGTVSAGSNVYEITLEDAQKDSTFPQTIADALVDRVLEDAEAGDIDGVEFLNPSGMDDPYGLLPGRLLTVTDSDMGGASTHRVFGVSCDEEGVTAHIEPAGLPDESMIALRGLSRARRKNRSHTRGNKNLEYRGNTGKQFKRFIHDDWTGKTQDMGWLEARSLYNRFRRQQGQKQLSRRRYRQRFF